MKFDYYLSNFSFNSILQLISHTTEPVVQTWSIYAIRNFYDMNCKLTCKLIEKKIFKKYLNLLRY
jgi:hypothetical protein